MFNYRYKQYVPPPFHNKPQMHYNNTNYKINCSTSNNFQNCIESEKIANSNNNDDAIFEIFGLKIYFDDLLIICLLIFLYQEGLQDQYLFISLILLLLS